MKTNRRRAATRKVNVEPITVWGTLNQPVAEISEDTAKSIFTFLAVILLAIWIAPYWGGSSVRSAQASSLAPRVAGATIESSESTGGVPHTPEWYYIAHDIPGDVTTAFADAATQVLDVSEPVSQITEFYQPGVDAVWGAWTDLMQDPY